LASKIGNSLSDFWSRNNINDLHNPIEFRAKLQEILQTAKSASINRLPDTITDIQKNEFTSSVHEYLCADSSPMVKEVNKLCDQYESSYKLLEQALQVKSNNLHLDWIERMRYLGFRLVTGIGIAAIVLLAGFLAKKWDIPLPLLRMLA
jgi:hypothetical protein